jgi:uncharacterized protein (TIGR02001 family)
MTNSCRAPVRPWRAMRGLLLSALLPSAMLLCGRCGWAADTWGGSVTAGSDYLVRGVSRTDDHAALQFDFHYANTSGFIAGLFASNSQLDPDASEDVELSPFVGFTWSLGDDWRTRVLGSHYTYPWNKAGSRYDYDEVDLETEYRGWLNVGLTYSPNSPYLTRHYQLHSAESESIQVALQHRLVGNLMGSTGIGYAHLGGPQAVGYGYWSAGFDYDLRPFTFAVTYVGTTSQPLALFYGTSGGGRWTGTVIWRF